MFVFLWIISLSIILWGHPHCWRWQDFVLFYDWVVFYCVQTHTRTHRHPELLYSLICWWTLRCFHILAIVNKASVDQLFTFSSEIVSRNAEHHRYALKLLTLLALQEKLLMKSRLSTKSLVSLMPFLFQPWYQMRHFGSDG